jgi:hypothetical protein
VSLLRAQRLVGAVWCAQLSVIGEERISTYLDAAHRAGYQASPGSGGNMARALVRLSGLPRRAK